MANTATSMFFDGSNDNPDYIDYSENLGHAEESGQT